MARHTPHKILSGPRPPGHSVDGWRQAADYSAGHFIHFSPLCISRVSNSCFLRDAARITVDGDVGGGGWRLNVFRFHKYNNPMCVSLFFTVNRQRNWSWDAVQCKDGWRKGGST